MDVLNGPEVRKNWRRTWLECLLMLSDLELQQRWIDKKIQNPAWTYIEFMCAYFDDCLGAWGGYQYFIENEFLSEAEYSCIKEFHGILVGYKPPSGDHDPEAILKDPRWIAIVDIGHKSTSFLEKIISDPSEKEVFSKKLYAPELTARDYNWPNI